MHCYLHEAKTLTGPWFGLNVELVMREDKR